MALQSSSPICSCPDEHLVLVLQIGIEKGILDSPDINYFKLVSRRFYHVALNDRIWIEVARKISTYLAERFIQLNKELYQATEMNFYIFDLLKKDVSQTVFQAREASPLLNKWVDEEIFKKNITIEKIRMLKRKILRGAGRILKERENTLDKFLGDNTIFVYVNSDSNPIDSIFRLHPTRRDITGAKNR
ncbi:MAG: hypothetical protein KR126chlam4_00926 [Candidatus Anoxychlamydiales bacterium]|nr:hypothetical protein [Candidatus Anoxychlamydiales bacterium]NGX41090.1 hypothetical protein [Candidatus Anoxychlamydiales bacterium]